MISLRRADKYFDRGGSSELHVMKEISLELPEKGVVAIFGRSGCGKTTLLNAIGGLTNLSSGEISVGDKCICTKDDDLRNRYIGYVFQDYCLNPQETVYENVADALYLAGLMDEQEVSVRVEEALACVGMERFVRRLPGTLSGGQQQRVAIARAIVKNPAVLLADEPTGNLDEENTHRVMQLLQAFGKTHLVVLVTHEEDLVVQYCDQVVELSDGEVMSVRKVEKDGFATKRNKNHIYLGELELQEMESSFGHFRFYGEVPEQLPDIQLVNVQGQLYVRILTPEVRFLEEGSELQLLEGRYREERKERQECVQELTMPRELPEPRKKLGQLFRWKNTILLAWKDTRGGNRRSKGLRLALALVAILLVWFVALFGTSLEQILHAREANNANSFYLYISNAAMAETLRQGMESGAAGIDYAGFSEELQMQDLTFYPNMNQFETIAEDRNLLDSMTFHGAVFSEKLLADAGVVCGKAQGLACNEMVLTRAAAEVLIENCRFECIDTYEELLGLEMADYGEHVFCKIVGIVDSPEYAVYYSEEELARKRYQNDLPGRIKLASDYNQAVEPGTVFLRVKGNSEMTIPVIGSQVCINGVELTVSGGCNISFSYEDWLACQGITKRERSEETSEYEYIEYYYSEYRRYAEYCYANRQEVECTPHMLLFLEGNEDVGLMKVAELSGNVMYYYAARYKKEHGHFPDEVQLESAIFNYEYPEWEIEEELMGRGMEEDRDCVLLLSDEDYVMCSKSCGETSGIGLPDQEQYRVYVTLHANDVELAEKFLQENFASASAPFVWKRAFFTPQDLYELELELCKDQCIAALVIGGIAIAIMCGCVYMLMRSRILVRSKEIGIYRCIGVRKSNVVFRFLVEAFVLVGSSAGVAFLIASGVLWWTQTGSLRYMTQGVIYYPVWLGCGLLVLLLLLTTTCGILSILRVLRRTPSEIMAESER